MYEKCTDFVRNMITEIVEQIISIFMNILIEILKLIIKMKDLGGKIMGTMAINLFMLDGMVKTGQSIWNGPLGDVVAFLCFHPHTPVLLDDGREKKMKNIKIGDILVNGSKVLGVLGN